MIKIMLTFFLLNLCAIWQDSTENIRSRTCHIIKSIEIIDSYDSLPENVKFHIGIIKFMIGKEYLGSGVNSQ